MMIFVIPCEEAAAERAGLVDGLEPLGEFRLIFQRFEAGLQERVVIRCTGAAVGFDHAEVGEHQGRCLGLHGGAAIGVQRQLVGWDSVFGHGVLE